MPSLLQTLLPKEVTEGKDLTELPYDVVKDIQNNIRKGAADDDQDWASALHLVHKGYEVEGIQRPDPSMAAAWKQYEANIEYAVKMLVKYRSLDADWRMSQALVHEAMQRQVSFRITTEHGDKAVDNYTTKAKSLDDLIEFIKSRNTDLMDIRVNKWNSGHSATLTFSKWNVKRNYRLKIEPAI